MSRRPARPPATALILGIGIVLLFFTLGVRARTLIILGLLVLLPGIWWRWQTREFRSGVRSLRRGDGERAVEQFRSFLARAETEGGFLRYQAFFNLGRPYDYIGAARNNLGAIALRSGDREEARRQFDAVLARPTRFGPAYYGRAALSLLEGDLDAAKVIASKALAADPGYRPAAILLALVHAERGDRTGAEQVLTRVRKPIEWDEAQSLWAKMYRQWGAEAEAERWAG